MHFNQLIVTFRLRALAAIGVAGGLIGTVLLNEKTAQVTRFNDVAFAGAMLFIAVLWLAVWAIDLSDYHRLLLGAVTELLRLERESNGVIRLSTSISKKAEKGWDTVARTLFYVLPLAALIATGVISYKHAPSDEPKPPPSQSADPAPTLRTWREGPPRNARGREPRAPPPPDAQPSRTTPHRS